MTGDCSETARELHFFLDGEITEEKRARIQAHLDDCPPCWKAFDFEADVRTLIADKLKVDVPADLAARIRAAIAAECD